MRRFILVFVLAIFSAQAYSAVYWTVKSNGVAAFSNGKVALHLDKSFAPAGPNPSGTSWTTCKGDFVYFHSDPSGNQFSNEVISRMTAIAISASKTKSRLRLAIDINSSGYCYTNQIFDQG